MHVKLGFLHALARQHALALVVDLGYVMLGLLPVPAEDHLENVCYVIHEVHRVIPANDQITRFEVRPRIDPLISLNIGLDFWDCHGGHAEKDRMHVAPVEQAANVSGPRPPR